MLFIITIPFSYPSPSPVQARDQPVELFKSERTFTGNQLPFVGFSYTRERLAVRLLGRILYVC